MSSNYFSTSHTIDRDLLSISPGNLDYQFYLLSGAEIVPSFCNSLTNTPTLPLLCLYSPQWSPPSPWSSPPTPSLNRSGLRGCLCYRFSHMNPLCGRLPGSTNRNLPSQAVSPILLSEDLILLQCLRNLPPRTHSDWPHFVCILNQCMRKLQPPTKLPNFCSLLIHTHLGLEVDGEDQNGCPPDK